MLEKQEALSKDYITGGALPRLFIPKSRSIFAHGGSAIRPYFLASTETVYSVNVLERALTTYLADPSAAAQAFDGRAVPVVSVNQEIGERRKKDVFVEEPAAPAAASGAKGGVAAAAAAVVAGLPVPSDDRTQDLYAEALAKVPELAPLGPLLVSSKRFDLTEPEVRRTDPSGARFGAQWLTDPPAVLSRSAHVDRVQRLAGETRF